MFYVGNLKGVGRIYQQILVDTYSKVAFAKLYTTKTGITAPDILNDKVIPFFEEKEVSILRILTDRGSEYCGKLEHLDLDEWLEEYNSRRTHQGKMCCGRIPIETFMDGLQVGKEKQLTA